MTTPRPVNLLMQVMGLLILAATVLLQAFYVRQTDFTGLLITLVILLGAYLWIHRPQADPSIYRWNILTGILLRLATIFILPWLSDDVYRFIWDGRLIHAGVNPYLYTPAEWLKSSASQSWSSLYALLNSPHYYSAYPTVAQLTFYLGTWMAPGPSFLMASIGIKVILFGAEMLNLILLKQLLKDEHKVSLYASHPVIIIEGLGNLHYEVVMITFLLLFVRALKAQRYRWSGAWWALAIGAKLTPAMYVPLIYRFLPVKARRTWLVASAVILGLLLLPFLHLDILVNFASSLDLYFRKFEFNGGLYYLVRQLGLWFSGYNLIQFIGPGLSLVTLVILMILTMRQQVKNGAMLIQQIFWLQMIYLLGATTVHPWYILVPAFWGLLAGWYFPLLWLFLAWLSYSHYHQGLYYERLGWVAIEYVLLVGAIYVEWRVKRRGMFFTPENLI